MDISSPSAQGVAAAGISAFIDAIHRDTRIEPHGLIVQRHGRRIAEGYWAPHTGDRIRLVYSLSKTFTGTALALMIGEGRISLDDLVSDHLPDELEHATPITRRMRVRHIASMASGHDREMMLEAFGADRTDPVRGFFSIPPDAEPGTLFMYNQPPVLALATIIQRLAGQRLAEYLRPRVLDPIGIGDFRWAQLRPGVDMGFSGVHTNLDAIARLGQLYLDDGVWDGQRLLPEGWVADAASVQTPNPERLEPDWRRGYGFQVWMSKHGYRGDGAFGQYMVVMPELDAVVAMFSCVEDMQTVLDAMWEHLVPAMGPDAFAPSPDDDALSEQLAGLSMRTAAQRCGGAPPEPSTMTFTPSPHRATSHRTVTSIETAGNVMIVHEEDKSFEVPLTSEWTVVDSSLATSATSLDNGHLAVDLAFMETPHRLRIEVDPSTGTFTTRWPLMPLFGVGIQNRLATMRAPA